MTSIELERMGAFTDEAEYWDCMDPRLSRIRTSLFPFLGSLNRLVTPFELELALKYLMNEEVELMGDFRKMLEGREEVAKKEDRMKRYRATLNERAAEIASIKL